MMQIRDLYFNCRSVGTCFLIASTDTVVTSLNSDYIQLEQVSSWVWKERKERDEARRRTNADVRCRLVFEKYVSFRLMPLLQTSFPPIIKNAHSNASLNTFTYLVDQHSPLVYPYMMESSSSSDSFSWMIRRPVLVKNDKAVVKRYFIVWWCCRCWCGNILCEDCVPTIGKKSRSSSEVAETWWGEVSRRCGDLAINRQYNPPENHLILNGKSEAKKEPNQTSQHADANAHTY